MVLLYMVTWIPSIDPSHLVTWRTKSPHSLMMALPSERKLHGLRGFPIGDVDTGEYVIPSGND